MNILGIENRTENWRTVRHFHALSKEAKERLARQLLANHNGTTPSKIDLGSDEVHIELFWKGMRDYVYKKGGHKGDWVKKFAEIYDTLFQDLRELAKEPRYGFPELKDKNYSPSTSEYQSGLYTNLTGTEIDIVLQASDYLFIGEAKDESALKGVGKYVLVHQLIRQYVMAKTLVKLAESGRGEMRVIPFIVGTKLSSIRNHGQVRLMIDKGWLKDKNIVGWDKISTWTEES